MRGRRQPGKKEQRVVAPGRKLAPCLIGDPRAGRADSVSLELETDTGVTIVEGAVVFDRPRLTQVDGIGCEVSLAGHLLFFKNDDVPGVIGWIGSVLGKNGINIANFSLGRRSSGMKPNTPAEAIAVVHVDSPVPEAVLLELRKIPAVQQAKAIQLY